MRKMFPPSFWLMLYRTIVPSLKPPGGRLQTSMKPKSLSWL